MPDKKPKNMKKLKVQAEEKQEEIQVHKHESPALKQEIHEQQEAEKNPEPEKA
ncbi:MAG: hypothetical protein ABI690_30805 [Chloroflexota bacterium]